MLALALACGSNATALKALVGLRAAGGPIDHDVAPRVTGGVSGKGYEDLAAALQRALGLLLIGDPPSDPRLGVDIAAKW
jgi:hypothetical protein